MPWHRPLSYPAAKRRGENCAKAGDCVNPEFFRGNLIFLQSDRLFRLGTDAMVLADFAQIPSGAAVCDLCAGTGAVGLLLLAADPARSVTAVELQAEACAVMERTAAENDLGDSFRIVCADLREYRSALPHGAFRHVVCNPPYDPVAAGFAPENRAVAIARTELCCTLDDAASAAAWLLTTGGSLDLVYRPERLTDLLCVLRARKLEPKRLRFVRHSPGKAPSLVLVRAVSGGKPGLRVEPELVLHGADGSETEAYRRIYHLDSASES